MTLPASQLPKGAPVARAAIESDFARRVLGRREARRLAELMDEAETRARFPSPGASPPATGFPWRS